MSAEPIDPVAVREARKRPIFMLIECPACGFDAVKEANGLTLDYCPLCAEDNGRDQVMVERRQATLDDKVEGRNALAAFHEAVSEEKNDVP